MGFSECAFSFFFFICQLLIADVLQSPTAFSRNIKWARDDVAWECSRILFKFKRYATRPMNLDTMRHEPRAFHLRSGCGTTTPDAHSQRTFYAKPIVLLDSSLTRWLLTKQTTEQRDGTVYLNISSRTWGPAIASAWEISTARLTQTTGCTARGDVVVGSGQRCVYFHRLTAGRPKTT